MTVYHPRASMIGATTISKPRILPPKRKADILPRLMEFQRLIAEGMTADAAMRMIEGRDGQKAKLPPDEQFKDTRSKPKPKSPPSEIMAHMTREWQCTREIMARSGAGENRVKYFLLKELNDGVIESVRGRGRIPAKYRLTAPQASGATRTRAEGQTPSGDALVGGKQQSEGRA